MFFHDCLTQATADVIARDLDEDLPEELLPLIITDQAARLAGLEAESIGWH